MEHRTIWKTKLCACAALLTASLAFGGLALAHPAHADESGTAPNAVIATATTGLDSSQNTAEEEAQRKAKLARRTIADGLYNIGSTSQPKLSLAIKGESSKSGAKVVAAGRDDANMAQKWAVTWDDQTGYYKIRNLGSRKYLSVSGKVRAGAVVKQVGSAKSSAQLWEAVKADGGIALKPATSSFALATAGKGSKATLRLQKATSEPTAAQTFKARPADALEADRTYFIGNVASGKRLHIAGNSTKSGAKLDLAAPKNAKSQKFRLLKAGSAYRLQNVGSCYYAGAKGTTARQLENGSGKRSTWTVKLNLAEAAFTIAAPQSGKCLSGKSSKLSLKAPAADGQLFTFSETYAFKVFLNPGHGWNSGGNGAWDPGAMGGGHQEAELTHDLAKRVVSRLASSDVKVVNGEKYKLAFWRRLPTAVKLGCDAIVSIHFDAGSDSGTLKMVGVQGRAPGSKALADAVHKGIVSNLRLRDRGWSYRSDITCVNGPIPSMLAEVCYVDNAGDMQTYLSRRDAVASGIASGIVKASRTRAVVNGRA